MLINFISKTNAAFHDVSLILRLSLKLLPIMRNYSKQVEVARNTWQSANNRIGNNLVERKINLIWNVFFFCGYNHMLLFIASDLSHIKRVWQEILKTKFILSLLFIIIVCKSMLWILKHPKTTEIARHYHAKQNRWISILGDLTRNNL